MKNRSFLILLILLSTQVLLGCVAAAPTAVVVEPTYRPRPVYYRRPVRVVRPAPVIVVPRHAVAPRPYYHRPHGRGGRVIVVR